MKEQSFEEAISELESVVKRLESGNTGLDEALADFETAVHLVKYCNDKLSAAEQKLTVLGQGEQNDAGNH